MKDQVKINKDVLKNVEDICKELFRLLEIAVEVEVSQDKENEAVLVELDSKDSAGLIIGRRGETISAIQFVLGMIARNKLGGWVRVIVNVGDWRQKQEEELKNLALTAAQRARETSQDQTLYNLNSSQRRIVHLSLADQKDIATESLGEGRERYLVISLKK